MDHFDGNLLRGFAGNENDAPPVLLQHAGKVVAREANAAEHVDFKKTQPIGIGNIEKRFDFEDAEVVDEDVGFRDLLDEGLHPGGSSEVRRDAAEIRISDALADLLESRADASFGTAIDDHSCAFSRKCRGDGEANACGRAGHDCDLALESQVHGELIS